MNASSIFFAEHCITYVNICECMFHVLCCTLPFYKKFHFWCYIKCFFAPQVSSVSTSESSLLLVLCSSQGAFPLGNWPRAPCFYPVLVTQMAFPDNTKAAFPSCSSPNSNMSKRKSESMRILTKVYHESGDCDCIGLLLPGLSSVNSTQAS